MLDYEAQHLFVQLTISESAIAFSVGIVQMVKLKSKKTIYEINQIAKNVLNKIRIHTISN